MMLWMLLIGCNPHWTDVGAVAPTRAQLDTDKDGRVGEAEYKRVALRGRPFAEIDADGDGDLSEEEVLAMVLATDPLAFSTGRPDAKAKAAKKRQQDRNANRPKIENQPADTRKVLSEAQWTVRNILLSIKAEVRAKDHNHAVPTDDVIKAAAATADIRTAESRAVLLDLEKASDEVGIDFPASLRATVLANEPVTPTVVLPEEPLAEPGVGPFGGRIGGPGRPGGPGAGGRQAPEAEPAK